MCESGLVDVAFGHLWSVPVPVCELVYMVIMAVDVGIWDKGSSEKVPGAGELGDSSTLGSGKLEFCSAMWDGVRKNWKAGEWGCVAFVFVGVEVLFYGPLKKFRKVEDARRWSALKLHQ